MGLQLDLFEPQQSIETTASDQDTMAPACNKTLEINEILHMILSCVPKENFVNIRCVSKTWNSVGHNSGYHVDPVREETEHSYRYVEYADTIPIAFHSMLTPPFSQKGLPLIRSHGFQISMDCKFRSARFTELGDQFLTSLAVTQISLSGITFKDSGWHALLRMPDGILFREVDEAVRRLGVLDAYGECSSKQCVGHKVGLILHCAKGQQKRLPLSVRLRLWRAELALKMRD